jgi:hypothetical protein
MKKKNGKRKEEKNGKKYGLDILGLGRLRLPNQGIEFFPYPDFLILRFIGRLANYTPPRDYHIFFLYFEKKKKSTLEKTNPSTWFFFLRSIKKAQNQWNLLLTPINKIFRQYFRYYAYKFSNINVFSNSPKPQILQYIIFFERIH